MAQFRALIQTPRGSVSCLGHKSTGLIATVNGWDTGISVHARHVDGRDIFEICKTKGSNGDSHILLFTVTEDGIEIESP